MDNYGFLGSANVDGKAFHEAVNAILKNVEEYVRRREGENRKFWRKYGWTRLD
jgi:hypothetical protein